MGETKEIGETFDGIHYRVGNTVVPGFDNIYMRFARVELMFMYQKNLYMVFVTLNTEYNPHHNAYEVIGTLDHGIISSSSLADPFPLGGYEIGAGNNINLKVIRNAFDENLMKVPISLRNANRSRTTSRR